MNQENFIIEKLTDENGKSTFIVRQPQQNSMLTLAVCDSFIDIASVLEK